ncbi:MarR family winged helix-turn-helix transcriptional regulator [Nocardiopsis sp. CC223A]|uniref:MarR family winged helix-turn-helix transcriptional regulator n=1 Tax=Nocardiopsis sp. CC223A TaxID=3044051 RepID=UPI00278BFADB|nr:MarR family transcriptional regulator [Nocardiopsis sp. CC223A]
MNDDTADRITRLLPPWMSAVDAINAAVAARAGIGESDLACLHEIVVDGPLPAGELARRLRLTTGAITRMVDRLAADGHVHRLRDDADRRRVLVAAAPGVRERMTAHYARLDRATRGVLDGFSEEEGRAIARFFEESLRAVHALAEEDV